MKLSFIGDLMFGDQPVKFGYGFDSAHCVNGYNDSFRGIEHQLKNTDYVIGNFESIIKQRPKICSIQTWSMCCDERVVNVLKNNNISILSLANNHTMDYGVRWYNHTKKILTDNGIKIIGDKEKPYEIIDSDENGKIGIVGASYLKVFNSNIQYILNPEIEFWENTVQKLKENNVNTIIAFIHWGNEFVKLPNSKQFEISKHLDKLGISIIVGHHPHIVQPPCKIGNTNVYYSIGNIVSDYWQKRFRETIIFEVEVSNEALKFQQHLCLININGCPEYKKSEDLNFNPSNNLIADNKLISKARYKVRLEYIQNIISNFHKIKGKGFVVKWLFKRLLYILFNFRQELKRPETVYEKYKT
ncbi:MAG: CapA family protein [Candidatus Brocadiaceae bacterium]|nr:CapA family protein [Candidatus Brocadiaceae bacterium]